MTFDGELDVKTSGLVQATIKVSVVLDYLYKNSESWLLSFKALMRIMWKTNTMFDQSVSGRTYLDRQNQGKWSDEFGQYCGAVIKNTDYEFKMPMKKVYSGQTKNPRIFTMMKYRNMYLVINLTQSGQLFICLTME